MDLREYIATLSKKELDGLAARCNTTAGQLKQVAYGHRRAGAPLAISIDRETDGAITCEQLRPDIDWAYLRARHLRKSAA